MGRKIKIFRAGAYPGKVPFPVERLQQIVADYDPSQYAAGLVFGHPFDDSARWATFTALKLEGEDLEAEYEAVYPWVADIVNRGMFTYLSPYFIPPELSHTGRHYLGHVGMLGAKDPAVKGLENLRFNQHDPETIQRMIRNAAEALGSNAFALEHLAPLGQTARQPSAFYFQRSQDGSLAFHTGGVGPGPAPGKKTKEENPMKEKLIAMLGLKPEAADDEITTAFQARLDGTTQFRAEVSKVLGFAEPPKDDKEILGRLHETKIAGAFDQTQFAALQGDVAAMKAEKLVEHYEDQGKIIPATREAALSFAASDPERFKAFMEKAPRVAPAPGSVQDRSTGPEKDQASDLQKSWFSAAGFADGKAEELLGWKKPEKKPEAGQSQQ